ncbi:hypothetical protein PF008_g1847 [Phytophthora fragariae]|uniref:Uncharacterized protein n=1 Tax=Phytophthora fragariae TaxID=53985 RepID=A0A6G0SIW2_9STRA|nr:hypothetical protein PF008_g1847 [Phytophthora fragariae]
MASESRTGGQINFVWSAPDDTGGIPITKYRVYMADSQGTKQIAASNSHPVTRVSVYSNLLADTAYDFYLQAGNELIDNDGWGDISASFKFSTGDVTLPGPVILHSGHYEGNTGGKVVLDWDAPLDTGGALISSYTIFASNSSVPWFETVATYADSGLSAAVTQLSASTAYQFVVLGNNSVLPIKLPGSMSISQGSSVMRTTVDLSSWLSVGSVIKVVGSVFVVGNVSAAATNTISLTSAHLSTTILSQPGELLGQATNVTTQSTTAPTFPDPPPAPISPIRTGGMISFTVLSPDDTGGIQILDFVIFQNGKKLSEDSYEKVIFTVPKSFLISSFISVASLEPLTSYNFSALALNSRSLCNFAPIVGPERMFSTTDVSAPGMPMLAKYKTTGGGITMTIINPHDTGGKDIQSYRLYYKEDVLASPWQLGYNGSKHQATVAHLKPITNYAFRASVNNGYFDSVNSSILVVRTTDKSPPGACDPAQPVSATGGMLEVSWDYPPDDGGETVTHYYATIASHLDGSGRMGVKTTNKSCVFYRLLALSSYDVTIRAGNSYGYGPESAIATFDTKGVTPPTGEIKVNVELTSGGAASISFDEPIDLGGVEQSQMTYNFYLDRDNIVNISYSALKEFPVGSIGGSRRLQDVDHRRLQTSEIFSNILVGGMDPETLYGLQILPLSSYSSGEISSSFAVATTVPTIPSAPVALKYDNVTGGSVSLSWGEPADLGGVPLNGYSLYISNVSKSGPFTSKGDDLQTTGITIYGLVPSSKYWAYVNASNDIGTSPSSAVIPFTTRTISAPSSPRNIQITSVGFDSIECVWDAPNDFGGDVINGFIVTATETDSSTSPIEFPVFGLSAVLTGLTSDTAYSIYVATLNTLGDPSPASVTRYAKTSSGPEIVSKPQIGCVSANSVELFWYPYPAASNYHVFRDGTDIGTTTSSMFTNTGVLSSLTSYTIQTASLAGSSEPVVVTTIDPHYTTADVRCQGKSGHITELSYANNVSKRWVIDPTSRYAYITLKFSSFFLECDHDYVEILDAGSSVSLWKGGCVRTGRFDIQAESSVVVRFHSDDSVAQKGFELTYEIDGDSEDVIVVSGEFGDDVKGTGQMMNASEKGTASKAVKTISRAVELSTRGSAILVYPGSYSGLLNRDLKISSSNLTITTLKGPFWTTIDCEQASRFAQSTSSILVVEGLSLQNCIASDGGVFSIADGNFTGGNMLITNSRAVERGGALYTSGSNVTLDHVRIVQISAGADGGALHFVDSNVSMISSNVTKSTALRGGAVALRGISILSTTDTTFEDNNATGSGGATYVNGDISLDGVQLLKNKAPNGGGLAMDNGILTMENCIVENNSAAITGGGLLLSGASTVIATATSIHSNVAGTSGGGVYASGTINVNFDKQMTAPSTIMGNTALRGAGMYIFESNATFGGIQVENGSANESAGGVAIVDSDVAWSNVLIQTNEALEGGGLVLNNSRLTCKGPVLLTNNSAEDGGAIWVNSTLESGGGISILDSMIMHDGLSILANTAPSGGGVFVTGTSYIKNQNGTSSQALLQDNTATYSEPATGHGGGLYVAPSSHVDASGLDILGGSANRGSGVFVDGAVLALNDSLIQNGNASYGGGMCMVAVSSVMVWNCSFMGNYASQSGGAIESSGGEDVSNTLNLNNCSLVANTASISAGGISLTTTNLTGSDNVLRENVAVNSSGGGIAFLNQGSATLINWKLVNNTVQNNVTGRGGSIFITSGATVMIADSHVVSNEHATRMLSGGLIYVENAASILVVAKSTLEFGQSHSGGLIYSVDAAVYIRNSTLHRGYAFNFGAGIFAVTTKLDISDSIFYDNFAFFGGGGIFIKDGGSGSLTSTTTRQLASGSTADTPESLYSSLIKPNSTVRWPTVVVRDYYGAIASYDNVTRCRATLASDETASFTFNPATWILVDEGYIVFEGAEVLSNFRDTPYQLYVSCTLSPVVQSPLLVDITVDKCNPGYENVRGLCKPCVKGKYSLDGGKCYLCPAGATCEGKDESGTAIGVVFPQRQEGYFMAKTRSTYATSNCDSPDSWPSNDPCKAINQTNLADLLLNCSGDAENFAKFWGRNRIFSCLSGHEYYACDTNTACVEAPNVSVSTASSQVIDQCAVGYTGVVCATCADGYYKGSSGTCKLCHDPNDPTVHRTTHLLAMLPLVVAAVAFVFLCYLFTNAAEQRVVSHAQAAKRFQIYRNQSRSRALLLAAKARIERKAYAMMQAIVKRLRSKPPLFHIERRHFHVTWSPEKLKIMLGFFQVMGSFKEVYEIPWPDNMSHLMDICSLADFNFVDTTAAECLFKRDYFANYRLALFALLGMLALVFLVTFWGVLKYRVKLSTLPRHCVSCGLPVFALEHGSPNLLARRATLLTELKMEQKSRSESVEKNELNLLARVKSNFSMSSNQAFERANSSRVVQLVVRALNWVDRMTQLPASISTHKPRCPTSQRIKNEVRDMVVHSNIRLWRARVWMRLYYKAYQNRCIKLFFWVLLLFYPMLCQRVIGTFYCDEVGEHYYLTLDRSILCYEGTWLYYLPVSISLVVFWVFGVPLLFWVIISMKRSRGVSDTILLITHPSQDALKKSLLLKMRLDIADHGHVVNEEEIKLFETEMLTHFLRDRNLNEPSTVAQVGFIYHSYDTHFWWFEVWDLGRKLLLNCVISLLAKAGANRIICGLVVMLMYLSVMLFYQPSRDRSDSALAGVTNIQLFITLFCGLILKMGALYLDARVVQLVTSVAVVSNILTLIYAVYSILSTPWKMARRRNREDYRRALAAHVRKLWQSAYGYALTKVHLSNPDRGPMPLLVKNELARREKYQQEMDDLNAQLELTSAMLPPPSPVEHHEEILTASQVDVLEDEDAAPGAASQADALDEDVDPEEQTRTGEAVDAAPQAVDS